MLTSKQRSILRGYATNLPDLVYIGKEGINANVLKQIKDNLHAHELIKVKVQKGCEFTPKQLANEIVLVTESQVVGVIGSKIILYKYTTKKGFKHYLEN